MLASASCRNMHLGFMRLELEAHLLSAVMATTLSSRRLGYHPCACSAHKMQMRAPGKWMVRTDNAAGCVTLWEEPPAVERGIIMVLGAGSNCSPQAISQALRATRSRGGLGICVATKPFLFEGEQRQRKAIRTLDTLMTSADLLLVVDHEAFLKSDSMTVMEASTISNDAVILAVQVISELVSPRLHGTFHMTGPHGSKEMSSSEVLQLLRSSGKASIGFGKGFSEAEAVRRACLASPFLAHASCMAAKGLVICALAGSLQEDIRDQEAANVVLSLTHPESNCICFSFQDANLDRGFVQATIIVTGYDSGLCASAAHHRLQEPTPGSVCSTTSGVRTSSIEQHGPSCAVAKVWAQSRATLSKTVTFPVGVRTAEAEVPFEQVDPSALGSRASAGLGAAMCNIASAILGGNAEQPSLTQRAASMLEMERSRKGLMPAVEMAFKNGTFTGRCEGGLPDGKGRLTYADGSFYDGHWSQGKREGMGTFYYANGDMYQGSWHQDFRHGEGWLYFHTGDRLHAAFVKGKAHGEARYYSVDGGLLFGTFRDNWRHGNCLCIDALGTRWLEIYDRGMLVSRKQCN